MQFLFSPVTNHTAHTLPLQCLLGCLLLAVVNKRFGFNRKKVIHRQNRKGKGRAARARLLCFFEAARHRFSTNSGDASISKLPHTSVWDSDRSQTKILQKSTGEYLLHPLRTYVWICAFSRYLCRVLQAHIK